MMESSEEKKKIFYAIVLILTLIIMIVGATLAYFSLVASQKKDETVLYTGKLEINYIDGVHIKNPILIPKKNPSFYTTDGVYKNTFSVISTGTLEQTIEVELELSKNEFTPGIMRYAIFNEKGQTLKTGVLPKEGKTTLINNIYLEPTGKAKYTLMIWINSTDENQNSESGKTISGKINVHAKQLKY